MGDKLSELSITSSHHGVIINRVVEVVVLLDGVLMITVAVVVQSGVMAALPLN